MIIAVAGQIFGIPVSALVETARLTPDRVRRVKGHDAVVLRGEVIPLVRLSRLLGLSEAERPRAEEPGAEALDGDLRLLVVSIGGRQTGVVVDAFHEQMEVVLRPMDGLLAALPCYLGTTLLADGRVLLVLDLKELLG